MKSISNFSPRPLFILPSCLAVILGAWSPVSAQVKPGDFITADNAAKVKDLLPPGTYVRVLHGMSMKIVPTERIDWPPPYKEATEKYSAQARLGADKRSMVGYVAGQPFPLIDPNDPDAGTKVMWNVTFRPISTDDYDLRWFDCDSVYWGRNAPFREIYHIEIGHYAGYNIVGRTEVEPIPIDPDFKLTGRYYLFLLYPVLSPAADRGLGVVKWRYADPNRGDDLWTYTPGARRIRRLNDSIMDSATGPHSYHPNDFQGFSGKNQFYNWRFLGEKSMLGCTNTDLVPDRRCPTDGGASHCPDPWEMRHMYIVEGIARPDRFGGSLYSKEIMYVDDEADFVMFHDMYDRRGELFINYTSWLTFRDRAEPGARIAIYPFKREFQVGSSSLDVQSGLSGVCYHPSQNEPTHESWFINMGAVDKYWFTFQAMAEAAEHGRSRMGD